MLPPEASDKPQLYVAAGGSVNEVRDVIAFEIGMMSPPRRFSRAAGCAKLTGGCKVDFCVDGLFC
jgi:hypothetical protein